MSRQFRNSNWLKTNGFAPQVYLFRNIESGQVIYSQLPHVSVCITIREDFKTNQKKFLLKVLNILTN